MTVTRVWPLAAAIILAAIILDDGSPSSLHCPAPSELIWNPRTQTAYCEPYTETDFDR